MQNQEDNNNHFDSDDENSQNFDDDDQINDDNYDDSYDDSYDDDDYDGRNPFNNNDYDEYYQRRSGPYKVKEKKLEELEQARIASLKRMKQSESISSHPIPSNQQDLFQQPHIFITPQGL
ncbi:hypothetical protein QTN25_006023 [Entamoeba marina]